MLVLYHQGAILEGLVLLLMVMETVRSFLHMLLPDGGAGSIAGIATGGESGLNIVSIFGQWGATQLVLVCLYWILYLSDSSFATLILSMMALEYALRIAEGHLKPLTTSHTPPGAILNYIALPLTLCGAAWSFISRGGMFLPAFTL